MQRHRLASLLLLLAYAPVLAYIPAASGLELDTRLKAVGNWLNADPRDSVARFSVDPAYGLNVDARFTLSHAFESADPDKTSPWRWELAGELTALQGDVIENGALFSGQSSGETTQLINDSTRIVNLTTNISNGSRHAANARLDRAQLVWQRDKWRVQAGRQALSLGNGLVFNPKDIFSPFSPTATDRDFKNGEDALLVTRLADSGAELEAIFVGRSEPGDKSLTGDQSSFGLRYRATAQAFEYELVGARHFDATVAMASLSGPIGGAVWRVDWVGSWEASNFTQSFVANIDFGFSFRDQAGYAFAEFYHNGYGTNSAAETISELDADALERLGRGELFVLERNYLALGTSLGLTPLLNLTTSALVSLNDGAPLIQSALNYTAGNNLTLEAGGIFPLGGAGDEFGGVILQNAPNAADRILTATSSQLYLRAVWFL